MKIGNQNEVKGTKTIRARLVNKCMMTSATCLESVFGVFQARYKARTRASYPDTRQADFAKFENLNIDQ